MTTAAVAPPEPEDRPPIAVCGEDYDRLAALVAGGPHAAPGHALLAAELERAVLVEGAPAFDRVRLGSVATYRDLDRDRVRTVVLTLPHAVGPHAGEGGGQAVSVTAPIGAALLGLSPGQRLAWTEAGGRTRTIQLLAVRNDA